MFARIFKNRETFSFNPSNPVAKAASKSDCQNQQSSEAAPANTLPGFAAVLRGPGFVAVKGRKKSAPQPTQPSRESSALGTAESANSKSKKS